MADSARRPGGVLPTDIGPELETTLRSVVRSAKGTDGVFVGTRWRIVEQPYPTSRDEPCLVFMVQLRTGWKPVFYVTPTGTFAGIT